MRKPVSWYLRTATLAVVTGLALGSGAAMADDKPVRWKVQSWFPTKLPHVGTQITDISKKVKAVSGNNIQFQVFEPGALIPPAECFDAVSNGAVNACWGISGYYYGKHPALAIYSAVPFGPEWPEMLAFFYYGGGKERYEEIYAKNNIKGIMCGGTVSEASGWFRKEINSVEDLNGLKMRIFGLGAKVVEKLGVSAQLIPAGDIYPALELGTIDAAEFAMPAVDLQLGFHQVAKHYYFPGWHQPATLYELIINMDKWNELSKTQQAQIEMMCGDNVRQAIAEGEAKQAAALKAIEEKGVTAHEWSPEIIQAFRNAWEEVVVEESANYPEFKEAYEHYAKFREEYKPWRQVSTVKDQ
ncbi:MULTISPECIES: TRAP transporter substrate-binding protein [Neopusillimonas]|nr:MULTISPECIES: TRAP transporter substrate-binding protein [Alcaligenaceae]